MIINSKKKTHTQHYMASVLNPEKKFPHTTAAAHLVLDFVVVIVEIA